MNIGIMFKKLKKLSIYKRILISNILTISISIIIVSLTLFSLFSSSAIKEIIKMSHSTLEKSSYNSIYMLRQILSLSNQMINDEQIFASIVASNKDPLLDYIVRTKLKDIQTIYPFISYISLYNRNMDRVINTRCLSNDIEIDAIDKIKELNEKEQYNLYESYVRSIYDPNKELEQNVISFVILPNYLYDNHRPAIIINVNPDYILNPVYETKNMDKESVMVIDEKGRVITHINSELFLNDLSFQVHINEIMQLQNEGYLIEEVNKEKQLITYIRDPELGWLFVSVKPYRYLLSNIYNLRNITILGAFFLIVIGIFVSFLNIKDYRQKVEQLITKIKTIADDRNQKVSEENELEYLFESFNQIYSKSQELKSKVNFMSPVVKKAYIRALLKGSAQDITSPVEEVYDDQGSCFTVLIFRIDEFNKVKKNLYHKDQELNRFIICNISEELIGKDYMCMAVDIDEHDVAVLVQSESDIIDHALRWKIYEVQRIITEQFKFEISCGIGNGVISKKEIYCSYISALENIKYKFFMGNSSIIDSSDVSKHQKNIEYPQNIKKRILEELNLNNIKNTECELDQFFSEISQTTYDNALMYCNQLLLTILKRYNDVMETASYQGMRSYSNILSSFREEENMEGMLNIQKDLCREICDVRDRLKRNKIVEQIEKAKEYIWSHYNNPNLNIDLICENVYLSKGYFSKTFKSITNISPNDYLIEVRMQKAMALLKNTQLQVACVGEAVGIENSTYFYSLFKKKFGMTPVQFRQRDHKADNISQERND